jgi:hypothetical protein
MATFAAPEATGNPPVRASADGPPVSRFRFLPAVIVCGTVMLLAGVALAVYLRQSDGSPTASGEEQPHQKASRSRTIADERVALAVKFTPGQYSLVEKDRTVTRISAQGEKQESTDATTICGDLNIDPPDGRGEQAIRFICRRIKNDTEAAGRTLHYDSEGDPGRQDRELASVLGPMVGWEATITGRDGKIIRVEGVSDLMSRIRLSAPSEAGPMLGKLQEMLDGFLREMLTKHWAEAIPDHPVGPGDSWSARIKMGAVPLLGKMQVDCYCSVVALEGTPGQRTAVIDLKVDMTINNRQLDLAESMGVPVRVTIGHLTAYGDFVARFDTAIGLCTSITGNMDVQGDMVVEAPNGEKAAARLDVKTNTENTLTPQRDSAAPRAPSANP